MTRVLPALAPTPTRFVLLATLTPLLLTPLLLGTPAIADVLGDFPLCEASSVIQSPWDAQGVLVADNEVRKELFKFTNEGGVLVGFSSLEMPSKRRPRDIEAMAVIGRDLFIFGSHSRNKRCELKPKRRRSRVLRSTQGKLEEVRAFEIAPEAWAAAMTKPEACLAGLFTSPPPPAADAVCRALVYVESKATASRCGVLNIEGAAAEGGPEAQRIWIGLRSPLVDHRAVLLRLAPGNNEMRWDRVVLVHLGLRGVRSLDFDGGRLWGIAGPVDDSPGEFALWSMSSQALSGATGIAVIHDVQLPSFSEGLVVSNSRAIVVIDGDDKGDNEECLKPSHQIELDLSAVDEPLSPPPPAPGLGAPLLAPD